MRQQEQTKSFFHRIADRWQKQAIGDDDTYNIVHWRNHAALSVLEDLGGKRLLDVGCGTGQLVIEAAERGIDSLGIDFAEDMIEHCRANNKNDNRLARFRCESFFDLKESGEKFDVISAQGFIEYISSAELDLFLTRCDALLNRGGALAMGSRNRLFNVVSLNKFTQMERTLGIFDALVEEAMAFQASTTAEAAFAAIKQFEAIRPQPTSHPDTGIGVNLRYQFAPSELIYRARARGFVPHAIYPIHYHALPMTAVNASPAAHGKLATTIQELAPTDPCFIPYASSYVLDLRKAV